MLLINRCIAPYASLISSTSYVSDHHLVGPPALRSSPMLASAFHPRPGLDASSMKLLHIYHVMHSNLQVKDAQGCLPRRQKLLVRQD